MNQTNVYIKISTITNTYLSQHELPDTKYFKIKDLAIRGYTDIHTFEAGLVESFELDVNNNNIAMLPPEFIEEHFVYFESDYYYGHRIYIDKDNNAKHLIDVCGKLRIPEPKFLGNTEAERIAKELHTFHVARDLTYSIEKGRIVFHGNLPIGARFYIDFKSSEVTESTSVPKFYLEAVLAFIDWQWTGNDAKAAIYGKRCTQIKDKVFSFTYNEMLQYLLRR